MTFRRCYKCKVDFPATLEYFYESRKGSGKLGRSCKDCDKLYARNWHHTHKEHALTRNRQWKQENSARNAEVTSQRDMLRYHGITKEEANLLYSFFDTCAVCGDSLLDKKKNIDHNHETGRIRGVLCTRCNLSLGNFKDSVEVLQRALDYLRFYEE